MRPPAPVVEVGVALAVLTGTSADAGCGGMGGGDEIGGVLDLDVWEGSTAAFYCRKPVHGIWW